MFTKRLNKEKNKINSLIINSFLFLLENVRFP